MNTQQYRKLHGYLMQFKKTILPSWLSVFAAAPFLQSLVNVSASHCVLYFLHVLLSPTEEAAEAAVRVTRDVLR